MKCVCGYEKIGEGFDDNKWKDRDPEKVDFKRVEIIGKIKKYQLGYVVWEPTDLSVYVCPECGTVRMDI